MSSGFGFAEQDGLQATTLAVFTVLSALRQDWGGALIVSAGLGDLGAAVAMAAHVAGAACLSIEPDAGVCRAAMRAGACDFLVNTVDESLRVLKNEIRQRRPLSVALEMDFAPALTELLERGVLPEVFTSAAGRNEAVLAAAQAYASQAAQVVDLDGSLSNVAQRLEAQELLQAATEPGGRTPRTLVFASSAELRSFDARLTQVLPEAQAQRRWAAAAPRLFHRDRPFQRAVLLTRREMGTLELS